MGDSINRVLLGLFVLQKLNSITKIEYIKEFNIIIVGQNKKQRNLKLGASISVNKLKQQIYVSHTSIIEKLKVMIFYVEIDRGVLSIKENCGEHGKNRQIGFCKNFQDYLELKGSTSAEIVMAET